MADVIQYCHVAAGVLVLGLVMTVYLCCCGLISNSSSGHPDLARSMRVTFRWSQRLLLAAMWICWLLLLPTLVLMKIKNNTLFTVSWVDLAFIIITIVWLCQWRLGHIIRLNAQALRVMKQPRMQKRFYLHACSWVIFAGILMMIHGALFKYIFY